MAARVVQRVAQEEVFENFPLMHATGAKAAGQIASVVAGGVLLALMGAGRALTPRPARAESGRRLPVRAFPADKKKTFTRILELAQVFFNLCDLE